MNTVSEVLARLDGEGWTEQFEAQAGGLHCVKCDETAPAEDYQVDSTERFEGSSDPGDESIIFALTSPCGHRGTFVSTYGADVPGYTADVIRALSRNA